MTYEQTEWFRERIEAWLAGGLSADERAQFEELRNGDPAAAQMLEARMAEERQLRDLLAADRPDEAFEDRLIAGWRDRTLPRRLVHPMVRWAATGVAAAIVLGAVGYYSDIALNKSSSQTVQTTPSSGITPLRMQAADVPLNSAIERPRDQSALAEEQHETTVRELLDDSQRLITERKYEQAGQILDQVLELDPANEYAQSIQPIVKDYAALGSEVAQYTDQFELRLNQAQEKPVPYDDIFRYPDKWPELRRHRGAHEAEDAPYSLEERDIKVKSFEVAAGIKQQLQVPDGGSILLGGMKLEGGEHFRPGDLLAQADANVLHGDGHVELGQDRQAPMNARERAAHRPPAPPPPVTASPPEPALVTDRKVIRNGTVEYEIDSFDSASLTIARIVTEEKGYLAGTESEKLPNGKVRGTIVVRVPPDRLDTLMLKLRGLGDLKNQKLTAQDVTRQYTDLAGELRAARAMEQRLIEMIKTGKGEIEHLLEAEKQLGQWRTTIEKLEGEIRYFDNQVAMSTLAITLQERDIQSPMAAFQSEQVTASIETEAVESVYAAAREAVDEFKGRIIEAELKQYDAGQFGGRIVADIPADQTDGLVARLRQLDGRMASFSRERKQTTQGGSGAPTPSVKVEQRDTRVILTLYNLANVQPRRTAQIALAAENVDAAFSSVMDVVQQSGGRVVSTSLNRGKPEQISAALHFEIPVDQAPAVQTALGGIGQTLRFELVENPDSQNVTAAKQGFRLVIHALAGIPPRETIVLRVAAEDVPTAYHAFQTGLQEQAIAARIITAQLHQQDQQNVTASLDFEVLRDAQPAAWKLIEAGSTPVYQSVVRAPESETVTDAKVRIRMTLADIEQLPPRTTMRMQVEVRDVEQVMGSIQAAAATTGARIVDSTFNTDPQSGSRATLVLDLPQSQAGELTDRITASGVVRQVNSSRDAQAPEGEAARTRIELSLSSGERLIAGDAGFIDSLRQGMSTSLRGLLWSLQLIVIGLFLVGPWALLAWGGTKLWRKSRRKAAAG